MAAGKEGACQSAGSLFIVIYSLELRPKLGRFATMRLNLRRIEINNDFTVVLSKQVLFYHTF